VLDVRVLRLGLEISTVFFNLEEEWDEYLMYVRIKGTIGEE
jgi:hypothetical protein